VSDKEPSISSVNLLGNGAHAERERSCPWDKERTHSRSSPACWEETYAIAGCFRRRRSKKIIEELGDVLLQVILHSCRGRNDALPWKDVMLWLYGKTPIRRHP